MPTWNLYSNEVYEERRKLREFGGRKKYDDFPRTMPSTYKAQALLELSTRLELEDRCKVLDKLIQHVDNLLDAESQADVSKCVDSIREIRIALS